MAETQQLIVDLRLRDNLSLGLGKVRDQIGNFGDTISLQAIKANNAIGNLGDQVRSKFAGMGADIRKGIGLGLGIGTIQLVSQGISELTGFLKDSVQAFADEEAGIKRLTQALETNIPAWDGDSVAIEKAIKARERLGFADDELRESLGSLAAATHDIGQAFDIQSTAMDLARFKNISLAQATAELVRVQAGQFRALKSLGIEIDANATKEEALAAVQKVVAGQADAFGDTAAGAMARAGIAVQNLQEDIGEKLIPLIGKAAEALDDILTKDLSSLGKNTEREIADITKSLQDLGEFLNLDDLGDFGRDLAVFFRIADGGTKVTSDLTASYSAMERAIAEASLAGKELAGTSVEVSAEQLRVAKATVDASAAHLDLAEAQTLATSAAVGDTAAIRALAVAQAADKRASDELKAASDELKVAQNELTTAVLKVPPVMLGAGNGTDTYSDALLRNANAADIATLANARLTAAQLRATVSLNTSLPTGSADTQFANAFSSGGDQAALDQRSRIQAELRAEAERKAAEALANAKTAAAAYADVLRDKLASALDKSSDRATFLFDKLHQRHLQAIADTEKLAAKQHDAALQQIADSLKVRLEANAAPVTAAEEAQRRLELARQRRDLGSSLQSAQQSGDPLAIRNAQEALQSFNAAQRINSLRETQAKLDAAAQAEARDQQKVADDKLAAAKIAYAKAIETENDRAKKQRADFDRELAALKKRDAGASPSKVAADVRKLEEKFGITTDERGFHHIGEVLAKAIKDVEITPTIIVKPIVNVTVQGKEKAEPVTKAPKDILSPIVTDVGEAAEVATPRLAAFTMAETEAGTAGITAADGLATFTKRLGELAVLALPVRPIDQPAPDDQLSAVLMAIKSIPINIPAPNVTLYATIYTPPQYLNGRLIASALASTQSVTATPGVRTGTLRPGA